MRFMASTCLKEGMIVAESVFNNENQLLISKGHILKQQYIKRIKASGLNGIFIEKDMKKIQCIKTYINETLRGKTWNVLNSILMAQSDHIYLTPDDKGIIDIMLDNILDNEDIILSLMDLMIYDPSVFDHCMQVALYSLALGISLELNDKELYHLMIAGMLHDYGKIFIEKEILRKTSQLTKDELIIIQSHCLKGYEHLKRYMLSGPTLKGILEHHESYNGEGYPNQMKADEISLFGRIICLADIYDAITSHRPYRKAMLPSEAMEYIMAYGSMIFDPKLAKLFCRSIAAYPPGTVVKLSNGLKGIVIRGNFGAPLRPVIKVLEDEEGESLERNMYDLDMCDMNKYRNITIIEVI